MAFARHDVDRQRRLLRAVMPVPTTHSISRLGLGVKLTFPCLSPLFLLASKLMALAILFVRNSVFVSTKHSAVTVTAV